MTSDAFFLGFDLSTQQLKAAVISRTSELLFEQSVHFDKDLPHHGIENGAIKGDDGKVTTPVALWLEALDVVMERLKAAGVPFEKIVAVSGAAQQHGSVYWSKNAASLLATLDPAKSLEAQLDPAFSLPDAPIWQDSSTTEQCRLLERAVGGPQELADITGSRAYERFTGPQISKIYHTQPEVYAATSRISLVSSFVASLFLGSFAPIEISDASGMNLMNVLTAKWDDTLLRACGGEELRSKLGEEPVLGGTVLGKVGQWWVSRWGFNPDCIVAPFTGDNPSTIVSLSSPGDAILSLGTSTTFLLSIPPSHEPPRRETTSHLLAHPTTPSGHVAMLCYKNGALAREQIRNRYASSSWDKFNELVESTPAGNDGYSGFYFPLPEIIPPGILGEYFFHNGEVVDSIPDKAHPRAILESQLLSIRARVLEILPSDATPLHRLVLAGGSSANHVLQQVAADILGMKVYIAESKEAAGVGGALLALYAWWRANGGEGAFEDMRGPDEPRLKEVAEPGPAAKVYEGLMDRYRIYEEEVIRQHSEA